MISEVVEKAPSTTPVQSEAGDIIEKIDGQEITPESDYSVLLNGKARKKTLVTLYNPQTKERWEEVVVPISNGVLNDLLYARWVKQRAADVDKWSNGRLGYVHIESMEMTASVPFIQIFWASTITVKVSSSIPVSMAEDVCTRILRFYSVERNALHR